MLNRKISPEVKIFFQNKIEVPIMTLLYSLIFWFYILYGSLSTLQTCLYCFSSIALVRLSISSFLVFFFFLDSQGWANEFSSLGRKQIG